MNKSFSFDVKNEIFEKNVEFDCCALSALAAVIHSNGSLLIKKDGITFSILTDNENLLKFLSKILKRFYGEDTSSFVITEIKKTKSNKYEIIFPIGIGMRILTDCGIIVRDKGNLTIEQGIDKNLVMEECCKLAYLSSSFAGSGTISLPGEKKNSGYHMEWSLSNEKQAEDISHLLAELNVISGKVERADKFVVYVKESESILSLLGKFGATKSYLKIQEEKTTREMRNKINRQSNCISGNISKSVDAAIRQIAAIEQIEKTVGLKSLSDDLQAVAKTRLKYPQSSLSDLQTHIGGKATKGAIRFRLQAIEKIAKDLSGE